LVRLQTAHTPIVGAAARIKGDIIVPSMLSRRDGIAIGAQHLLKKTANQDLPIPLDRQCPD